MSFSKHSFRKRHSAFLTLALALFSCVPASGTHGELTDRALLRELEHATRTQRRLVNVEMVQPNPPKDKDKGSSPPPPESANFKSGILQIGWVQDLEKNNSLTYEYGFLFCLLGSIETLFNEAIPGSLASAYTNSFNPYYLVGPSIAVFALVICAIVFLSTNNHRGRCTGITGWASNRVIITAGLTFIATPLCIGIGDWGFGSLYLNNCGEGIKNAVLGGGTNVDHYFYSQLLVPVILGAIGLVFLVTMCINDRKTEQDRAKHYGFRLGVLAFCLIPIAQNSIQYWATDPFVQNWVFCICLFVVGFLWVYAAKKDFFGYCSGCKNGGE